MKTIIGLTGLIASGKGTVAKILMEKGYEYLSTSDIVREETKKRGLSGIRDNLISVANSLRANHGEGILAQKIIDKINNSGGSKFIVDGIRNVGEVKVLRQMDNFKLLGITAELDTRIKRVLARDRSSDPNTEEEIKQMFEKDKVTGVDVCFETADIVIENNADVQELSIKLTEVLFPTNGRPSWNEYYLEIADATSRRSTCLRRAFGAVIVNNGQIISTGYCGAPRGTPNCLDIGKCYRQERKIPSGEHYELCRSVHAEANAIIHAPRELMIGGTLYLLGRDLENENKQTGKPCKMCRRMIINAGITKVITKNENRIIEVNVSEWVKAANENPFKELDEAGY